MTADLLTRRMTTEELLAMPDDGKERWLINGELREKPMTVRNRFHSKIMATIAAYLFQWNAGLPQPRGEVLCGEAGVRLREGPDSTVGIDVAFFSSEVMIQQTDETTLVDGLPLLAVEILSPSDTVSEINEKKALYLKAGVPLIWFVDPYSRTATIFRPGASPEMISEGKELIGDPVLPGFRLPLAAIFE